MSLSATFNENGVVISNGKASEVFHYVAPMDEGQALRALQREHNGRASVSEASVQLITAILDNPRMDGYKGTCPARENISKEAKEAFRDLENEFMKPRFLAALPKSTKPEAQEKAYQEFASSLRAGGMYANAKSRVLRYFATSGQLPRTENGYLTVAAIEKLNTIAKAAVPAPEDGGMAEKLVALSLELSKDKVNLGDTATGLAALRSLLKVYEASANETAKAMTAIKGSGAKEEPKAIGPKVRAVVKKAKQQEQKPEAKEEAATPAILQHQAT